MPIRLLALIAVFGATGLPGQECAPREVPKLAPATEEPTCSLRERATGACDRKKREFWDQARTFSETFKIEQPGSFDAEFYEESFRVTGCAGAVVVPIVRAENVSKLELSLLAQGGAPLIAANARSVEGSIEFDGIELPQSARYTVRVRTWAERRSGKKCRLGRFGVCIDSTAFDGYPRSVEVRWRGSAGASPLDSGDTWRPLVEHGVPATRRLQLNAGSGVVVGVQSATRTPVLVRASVARGGIIAEQTLRSGNGTISIPARENAQTLVLRLALESSTPPSAAFEVKIGASDGGPVAPPNEERRTLAENTDTPSMIAPDVTEKWQFTATKGDVRLEVVPSGRAGLKIEIGVFGAETEETVLPRRTISDRTVVPIRIPADGRYIVDVKALAIEAPDNGGQARYTLKLTRGAGPR